MAVVVGVIVGFVFALRRPRAPFGLVLLLPLFAAAVEIIVNVVRFGVASMVLWTAILLALTVGATAVGGIVGRRYRSRSQ